MTLEFHSNNLCLPLKKEFLAGTYVDNRNSWVNLQLIQCQGHSGSSDEISIQCCSFSPCGRYIAVCLDKDLIVYRTSNWNCVSAIKTERKGIGVKFFPKSNIILLAEKSGNVKFFKFSEDKIEKLDIILGHNSMLMEALITEDENFIVTCDRDEKIRVTNYPNIYNIQCYCLGHTQFVCCIDLLATDKNVLISSSGDGSVRLWNIVTGAELLKYEAKKPGADVKINDLLFFTKIISFQLDKGHSLIAALEYKSDSVTILEVKGSLRNGLSIDAVNVIKHPATVWDIEFWKGCLISLLPDKEHPMTLKSYSSGSIQCPEYFKDLYDLLTLNWDLLVNTYKEKFDAFPLLFQYKKDKESFSNRMPKRKRCNEIQMV